MDYNFKNYRCSLCGKEYDPDEVQYVCPLDGGNLDVLLDYARIRKKYNVEDITSREDNSLWRYLPLLPVVDPGEGTPLRSAGWTPVYAPALLARQLGLHDFWVKDEGRNPTASLKDRASAVVLARARQIKAEVVVTASTGNAGAALAGMAAAIGHKAVIFAPKTAPAAKVAQLLVYGAQVILVDGNYDQAFDLTIQASQEFGWYCRNTGYNPFTVEGKKTAAFEIWEKVILDLDASQQPLNVFVSVGDGNIISGLHKGFKDLLELGWLETMPCIFGIQSTGSAAIANAFFAKTEKIIPVSANTIADSISVDLPRDGVRAVRAATQTAGAYLTVADDEIIHSIADLGKAGIFAEPAGATAYAGLKKALKQGLVHTDQAILVVNTGSGLKDVRAALQAVQAAPIIEPTMTALKAAFENMKEAMPVISIIAPVFNEKESLPELMRRLTPVMDSTGESWELILVDDGSRDGSTEIIRELGRQDARVRPIIFARNFGHQIAVTAGLDYSRGHAVVIIDADLQDPPEVILDLIAKWREGYQVVYAVRSEREGESWFKTFTASVFYRLIYRITDVKIPLDTGDFRLMDRAVVNVMNRMREKHRFLRGMSAWVGFQQVGVSYRRAARFAGKTKYPFRKMLKLALNAVTSFSYFPLQVSTYFGFFAAGIAILAIPVVIIGRLMGSQAFFGQATTLISVLFLGGVQLICLGILGEYIGRIYDEVKGRPLYIVSEAPVNEE